MMSSSTSTSQQGHRPALSSLSLIAVAVMAAASSSTSSVSAFVQQQGGRSNAMNNFQHQSSLKAALPVTAVHATSQRTFLLRLPQQHDHQRLAMSSSSSPSPMDDPVATGTTTTTTTTSLAASSGDGSEDHSSEIERLRNMAARLRAEATALEQEQKAELAAAALQAFEKFDTNKDGTVSVDELKAGLEKRLKTEVSDEQVKQLMSNFDTNDDGVLQPDEFVTVDVFRNQLEQFARQEKQAARDAQKTAQLESDAAKLLQAQLDMINDKPPTVTDRVVSVLPYLFPLLDGLQYAKFLVVENQDSALAAAAAILYGIYRSIPFGGFIAFFALNFLGGNLSINRLVRYNIQQAIFLDIALIIPGLFFALNQFIGLPPSIIEGGTDVVFATLLVAIAYASVSSLLGITPDKIPGISDAVTSRMPTIDMFDAQGRFTPRDRNADKKKDDDETK